MTSKLCVYCISKNESKFVDRFMDSFKDADLIIVGDTGSTDNTVELFKKRGAIVHDIKIDPWRFDYARNAVLDLIPSEYTCLFSVDIDEVMDTPNWKQIILNAWDTGQYNRLRYGFVLSQKEDGTTDKRFLANKIHSRQYRWVSPCHEVLMIQSPHIEKSTIIPIEVIHTPDREKSRSSYLPLLEMAVRENPRDWRVYHYYGRELYYYKQWEKAREILIRHSLYKEGWAPEKAASCRYAAECCINMNKSDEANQLYLEGISHCPTEREPYIAYARFLQRNNRHAETYKYVKMALQITNRKHHYLEDRYAWNEGPYDLLSVATYYIDKKKESLEYAITANKMAPNNKKITTNLEIIQKNIAKTN